jgi:DNA-binding NarL/FixJ family response regulator
VVIADVRMPPTHTDEGIRAALVIRSQWPDIAVLVLSQYVEERYAADLLSANTHGIGYLLKDRVADVAEFLDALRRVAAGGTALDPEVVAQLLVRRGGDPLDNLTDRERDVLALMAEGRSNAEIAATLVITDSAVSKHINSIFAKLGLYPHDAGHRRVLAVLRYLGVDPALCPGHLRGRRGRGWRGGAGGTGGAGARVGRSAGARVGRSAGAQVGSLAGARADSRHSGTARIGRLRYGCLVHVVTATWLRHPCSMGGRRDGSLLADGGSSGSRRSARLPRPRPVGLVGLLMRPARPRAGTWTVSPGWRLCRT